MAWKFAIRSLLIVMLSAALAGAAGLGCLRLHGVRLLSVQTASMAPTFQPGDGLIIKPISVAALRPGQIISYRDPRDPNVIITHRLIKIDPQTGWLTTAGDARHSADAIFPPRLVIGRATLLLPAFGRILDGLRSPLGLSLIIYLPAGLVIIAEVRRLTAIYARPFYSARL